MCQVRLPFLGMKTSICRQRASAICSWLGGEFLLAFLFSFPSLHLNVVAVDTCSFPAVVRSLILPAHRRVDRKCPPEPDPASLQLSRHKWSSYKYRSNHASRLPVIRCGCVPTSVLFPGGFAGGQFLVGLASVVFTLHTHLNGHTW